ncbi:MAG: Co2+/Mg2+ efflux protein ApaG [Bacteroidetes bacterium MedPE-SWsnd-G1]|uniref:Co2+/Mg2+ efflux protein ApaG n=1 Tax=Urechidicola vernalis TaxID=3075600 RepID=A0ABU2Y7A2_9FLAO|nr:Co2+/Mg2+ efflux protein ApaG [Urechidicola sp. P050]MDT0554074.1 Co2+/Mg2+ efflux protein ApaG [Urechidicola sp. P050]OIQ40972.1 MAG: Co2+/Mg2+ efflux protein ApaG [Bacteroidetes bacterium MedPE-SWsnd-G1]
MVQQVTNGIKISVETNFVGTSYHHERLHYAFDYKITIENQSNDSVQLLARHWNIFDSLNNIEIVEGAGVVGKKPILKPGGSHSYRSHCLLTSTLGAMNGYYEMVNFTTTKPFLVQIPTFQLLASGALN